MLVYPVVSSQTDKAVALFVRREQAERFLEAVRADEPELGGVYETIWRNARAASA